MATWRCPACGDLAYNGRTCRSCGWSRRTGYWTRCFARAFSFRTIALSMLLAFLTAIVVSALGGADSGIGGPLVAIVGFGSWCALTFSDDDPVSWFLG
jgi:hypothetical protein